jgi:hypothetical protein
VADMAAADPPRSGINGCPPCAIAPAKPKEFITANSIIAIAAMHWPRALRTIAQIPERWADKPLKKRFLPALLGPRSAPPSSASLSRETRCVSRVSKSALKFFRLRALNRYLPRPPDTTPGHLERKVRALHGAGASRRNDLVCPSVKTSVAHLGHLVSSVCCAPGRLKNNLSLAGVRAVRTWRQFEASCWNSSDLEGGTMSSTEEPASETAPPQVVRLCCPR